MIEKRLGKRYTVPEIYRKYILFKFRKDSGEFVPMELLDFSSNGIRVKSPYTLPVDSAMECLISVPKSLTKEIPFIAKIKHCTQDESDEGYLIGAEIIQTSDKVWFDVFSRVHDFIKERIGNIY
ncbi:MAG: hypothetical protein A2169_08175 [Deltaproteobacteria bacterium RBG_13_47_9]|nr:MAG: hypothetical protein A2169_08175 [Deltaproteobacteria bacterium RBG_13_47_9]